MADNKIGALHVDLALNTARLRTDTDKAVRNFRDTERKMKRSLGGITRAAAALGVGLSAVGFVTFAQRAINTADEIGKLSTRLGASTEALSEYRHVAELSGITFRTLTMGFQRMTRRVAEAASGKGEAKDALIELNLAAQDLNKLAPEEQFEVLTDALMGVESQADRVRLAMRLFDSEGVSLLQTMSEGSAGLREMRQEARDLGISLSVEATQGAADANDAMRRLKAVGEALGLTLAKELGPAIADVAGWLQNQIPKAVQFASDAWAALRHFVIEGMQLIVVSAQKMMAVMGRLPDVLGGDRYREAAEWLDGFNLHLERSQENFVHAAAAAEKFKSSVQSTSGPQVGGADELTQIDKQAKAAEDRFNNMMITRLETVEQSLMNEEQRLFDSLARRQFIVEEAYENELISMQKRNELIEQLQADHEQALTDLKIGGLEERNRFTSLLEADSVKGTLRGLQELTSGVSANSRTLFRINKYSAIAEATMNAYSAFNKALAQGGLFGYSKALAILYTGLESVRQIQATQFGSGGGNAGAGVAPTAGGPDSFQDQTQVSATTEGPQGGVTFYVAGNFFATDDFRAAVVDATQEAVDNDEFVRVLGLNAN